MDVNQYMEQSLELQRRTAEALEALVKAGFQQVNVAHHSCGKTVGGSQVKHPETEVKDKQAEKKEEAKAETKQAEKKEEAKAETKKKRATADDARKALKAYAAVEGNDAAMELLTSWAPRPCPASPSPARTRTTSCSSSSTSARASDMADTPNMKMPPRRRAAGPVVQGPAATHRLPGAAHRRRPGGPGLLGP